MHKRRALIVGGSLGGLFAAHQLRSIGWDVDVFERTGDDLADRGAGIGTHRTLLEIMRRVGLGLDQSGSTAPRSYICLDRDNRLVHEMAMRRTMTAWSRLYRPLKDNLPSGSYHSGKLFESLETDDNAATTIFADGTRVSADLLIGADGFRSTVRNQILPEVKPAYAGYIAWRALVPQGDIPATAWEAIHQHYIFCVPEGELLVSYPVPTRDSDMHKGPLSYNVVWYRPTDEATLADFCTDGEGRLHEMSIPPPLIRPNVVADMKASARALLAPPIADVIERAEQPFFQPIYDLVSPRVVVGRVALLGDAAFVARPHVGAGVTKAALDALGMAQAISDTRGDLTAGLARYDRERRLLGDWLVARGRRMGALIKSRPKGEPAPSKAELDRRAEIIMRDYIAVAANIESLTTPRP
jgi:2-polyprenyl-6-methoxyphenol hydroxylase-like FAD-dependent oxidoreductase